eukprot:gene12978-biopygen3945
MECSGLSYSEVCQPIEIVYPHGKTHHSTAGQKMWYLPITATHKDCISPIHSQHSTEYTPRKQHGPPREMGLCAAAHAFCNAPFFYFRISYITISSNV